MPRSAVFGYPKDKDGISFR